MGTSNFWNKNASKVYAVGADEEVKFKQCPECLHRFYDYDSDYPEKEEGVCPVCEEEVTFENEEEGRPLESEQWEDLQEYIIESLSEIKGFEADGKSSDNERNFTGTILGGLSASKSFGGAEVEVRVQAMLRSGYYEGANLDYEEPELLVDGYARDFDGSYIADQFEMSMNNGMAKIQSKNALKWAEKTKDELMQKLEDVYTKISMPLRKVATFSNGETIYEKA